MDHGKPSAEFFSPVSSAEDSKAVRRASYDWANFMVDTGHLPSWPLIEIRRPWDSSSQILSTVPAVPLVKDDGFADELGRRLLEFGKNSGGTSLRGWHASPFAQYSAILALR